MVLLFSSLIGSTLMAGVLVTPALLVHFYWYKPHPTPHRHYININIEAWLFWAAANLLISWYLAMIIDIIPAVARFIISVSWGHVSEFIKSRIEMYESVKGTIKPVLYAASGWVSWIILFANIFDLYDAGEPQNSAASYTPRVGRPPSLERSRLKCSAQVAQTIEFLFFLVLVVCMQKMLSHAIGKSSNTSRPCSR